MGRYNLVVEDDEDVVWEEDEVGKVTHILLVGFFFKPWFKSCLGK